jgi:hypothetical protein
MNMLLIFIRRLGQGLLFIKIGFLPPKLSKEISDDTVIIDAWRFDPRRIV